MIVLGSLAVTLCIIIAAIMYDRYQFRRERRAVYARAVELRARYDRNDPDGVNPWLIYFPLSAELDAEWKRGLGERPR